MEYTGFIARRYLFSKKHISLISTLTFISITGVTIGTALLIVVLSVFNGFFDVIKGFLLSYDPDIRIESAEARTFPKNDDWLEKLHSIPEVSVVSPYVVGKALLTHNDDESKVVEVKGVNREQFFQLIDIEQSITNGIFDVSVRSGNPGIIIHDQLRSDLGLAIGEQIALLSAAGMKNALTQVTTPRLYRFETRGTYDLQQISGGPQVYVDLVAAQRLFRTRSNLSGIDIKLTDSERAEAVKAILEGRLGPDYKISTWYDLQKPLYDVMYLEKWGAYLILMIIIIVAVLNILASLMMIVIQKRRDVGILISMGYNQSAIKRIFRKQGLYIGLIGCALGGGIGLLLTWMQKTYGIIKLSSAFIISSYPVDVRVLDVSIILIGSLILCMAASWYPANRASQVQPADAIRFE